MTVDEMLKYVTADKNLNPDYEQSVVSTEFLTTTDNL